jgi:presenilin-like A22 family membrane protease
MKHTWKITIILLCLFVLSQFIGLYIVNYYNINDLPYDIERPEIDKDFSFIPIFIVLVIGTTIALLLIKFKTKLLWKIWFFLSVFITLAISFSVFINQNIAAILAIILSLFKIVKRNIFVHNFTELFIYGALAAIFSPLFSVLSISILLILISIYDYVAVNKTKHMVKLAKYQSGLKLFAGFFIPYKKTSAVLGGGDIAFSMMFTGVVMIYYGLISLIIPLFTTGALLFLFVKSEKKKFYPAMPIITLGCFVGYLMVLLFNFVF